MAVFEKRTCGRVNLDDTQPLTCSILGAQNVQGHMEFLLQVARSIALDNKWTISRRYSDFLTLKNYFLVTAVDLPLPPKKIFGNMEREFVAERQQGLQDFVNIILSHPVLSQNINVKRFFDPENYVENYNELGLQFVSMFLRSEPQWTLVEPLFDLGWRIRKAYYLLKPKADPKQRFLLSWAALGPDCYLDDKDLQSYMKSLSTLLLIEITNIFLSKYFLEILDRLRNLVFKMMTQIKPGVPPQNTGKFDLSLGKITGLTVTARFTMKKSQLHSALVNKLKDELVNFGKWSDELASEVPSRWSIHGDLILLPENCFSSSVWNEFLGKRLWDIIANVFNKTKVAKQGCIKNDIVRTPTVTILRGENGWVEHIDNKIKYKFNVETNMFSRGNITEKIRVARMDCREEIIIDLFAGIGYFTLPFLVHSKAAHVHACDCNPNAIEALKKNLLLNKVQNHCTVYEGNCAEVAPRDIADRVYLGLIPSSKVGWKAACMALKHNSGGVLHIHHNVTTKIPSTDAENCDFQDSENIKDKSVKERKRAIRSQFGEEICMDIMKIFNILYNKPWTVELLHVEFVKQYAPHVDHVVFDVLCTPSNELYEVT
ncbi:tRNA wybutosine-synthesizing protein 2 [Nymphon striatum]|nr:tRNA wybutosine-synthesizing protein 2 [Nymphon striatum]